MNKKILRAFFSIDPHITFLNHGSFGATPKPVMRVYQKWQRFSEVQPVQFYARQSNDLLSASRRDLSQILKTDPDNLVFIPNATTGINIIGRCLSLSRGDVLLTTDHEYGAIDKTWDYLSRKTGFKVTVKNIDIPTIDDDQIISSVFESLPANVKALSLSHVTSPTALVFPVKEICKRARELGIITIIDGAHAPGQVELNLDELECDFYVGNLHKWLCAPKGTAFLFAHPRIQSIIEPFVVSWGWETEPYRSRLISYLEWTGTRDISSYLSVQSAIDFHQKHIQGKPQNRCHQLAVETQKAIAELFGNSPLTLYPDAYSCQMASSILPSGLILPDQLKALLYSKHHIEIPIIPWGDKILIRYSYQIYNNDNDMGKLLAALREIFLHRSAVLKKSKNPKDNPKSTQH